MTKILQIFNQYTERGGEEKSVERIYEHGSDHFRFERYLVASESWKGPSAPGKLSQLRKLFYNADTVRELTEKWERSRPDVALLHNIYPVISPAVLDFCLQRDLPAIQYVHNFRPFSVSGTLWTGRRVAEESLQGDYRAEVISGAWQGSVIKSALFALLLKKLHKSGWLEAVKCWVAISDFMRNKFIEAGVAENQIVTLRHSWDAMEVVPPAQDEGYYLFLGRLVPEKGVLTLLEAWRLLERELGARTPRLLIGGEGVLKEQVQKAQQEMTAVQYLGFVDGERKSSLIKAARALLAPSIWWEPLGLVTYEAYDYGKPMLAAASGGLTETVENAVTGYLHEPGNAGSLCHDVRKMEQLTVAEREEMGRKGREWLLAEANPEQWKKSFAAIIDRVI
ncbi:MAG: glycosyltransferase family 4 protein [Verrucomicrobiales bacterium]